jgi:pimeloyl-ACP methyl ester carboxylesterase
MGISIEKVKTDDFEMQYFRFGSGERVFVILPGISIQSVMVSAQLVADAYADFAADYTVYVFDRREVLPPVYTVRDMARDTAAAMKALGLENIYLFGASQGGMMALVIAIEYPELVKKMVLGSTSAHIRDDQYASLAGWAEKARARDGVGLFLDFGQAIYPPEVYTQFKDALVTAGESVTVEEFDRFIILAEGTRGFNVADQLHKIQCPVLAIGVYEDAVLDSDATMEIAEKLDERSDFQLFMYIGYGHAAFDTAPDYRARMRRFFDR